jgi:hypothetical protein
MLLMVAQVCNALASLPMSFLPRATAAMAA